MADSIEKDFKIIATKRNINSPFTELPFNHKLIIDSLYISRIADHSYSLTKVCLKLPYYGINKYKLLGLLYEYLPAFPTDSRVEIIDYLINDNFHFFFAHWSDVVRDFYHHLIIYRITLAWVRDIYNKTIPKALDAIYKSRITKRFVPLDEDTKNVLKIRENVHILEKTIDTFPKTQQTILKNSAFCFREMSKKAQKWMNGKRSVLDVPELIFPFKDLSVD
ncbi:hypothetical protein EIN_387270 [Entamoeba invadens IP1]|uniref:Uncharacterized protein n=1 Tax=Entamoeba invadens IP1 TaxID=370355 RepID=A0A0A1UAE2_ENTIV|nr:hypothetical protein EIN_387270 [Entamoeba invadens IP1]ELP92003.1 hypothetical protein EIN_387270 [Entamoeba invadens IP1]|eukprot:XP_004258774.1 hypothetical protein EIN_387270 [Entamoeba invadens IP1]